MIHNKGRALAFVIVLIHQVFSKEDSILPLHFITPANFNYSHLMTQYIATCGISSVCNKSLVPYPDLEHDSFCPECSCDSMCITDPNSIPCCPDLYFRNNVLHCRSLEITRNAENPARHYFELVDFCPEDASKQLKNKCSKHRKPSERMLTPPVSDRKRHLLFQNKFCAECHNVSNIDPLFLMFECKAPTDFNYLSTYEEIIEKADKSQCKISFSASENHTRCKSEITRKTISSCNVTGTWMTYDSSIETACNSAYVSVFKSVFKNVFCYMCNAPNPLVLPTTLTETCQKSVSPFAKLCTGYPRVQATFPYKNIFCKICNNVLEQFFTNIQLNESFGNLQIQYSINLRNGLFENDNNFHRIPQSLGKRSLAIETLTNLVIKNVAFTGRGVCSLDILPTEYPEELGTACSCDFRCYKDCCIDLALTNNAQSCISSKFPPENDPHGKFRVIERCKIGGGSISCRIPDRENILNSVPVTDTRSGLTYINAICYFCNTRTLSEFPSKDFTPWGFNATCSQFINPFFYPNIHDFMKVLKTVNCSIGLLPNYAASTCSNGKATISACNTTGLWSSKDEDIQQACENPELDLDHLPEIGPTGNSEHIYRNIFCQMCNPVVEDPKDVIGFCGNETENTLATACEKLPLVQMSSAYRNAFCEKCHNYESENKELVLVVPSFPKIRLGGWPKDRPDFARTTMPTYRTLFSLSSYEEKDEFPRYTEKSCQENELLDRKQRVCRSIVCFPGKMVNNKSCVPLLPQTKNLRYGIYFNARLISNNTHLEKVETTVGLLLDYIYGRLVSITKLNKNHIRKDNHDITVNKDCTSKNLTGLQMNVNRTIFISDMIDRLQVEKYIVSFSNSYHTLKTKDNMFNFSFSQSTYPSDFLAECMYSSSDTRNTFSKRFKMVDVNELLLCQHTLLSPEEYTHNASLDTIHITSWNVSLPKNQFIMNENKSAQVCFMEFNASLPTEFGKEAQGPGSLFGLSLLTSICILISLVCLLIAFIVYCLFPSLRTLPGKNNMSLIFSLFWAQLMTILRPNISDFYTVAMVSAILLHFFWLAVFFWLQVCSFHMFRVFTRKTHVIKSEKDTCHAAIRYAAYAYGFPGFIVVSHLVVNVILSNGTMTGYENKQGIVNDKIAFIVTIISPLLLICISNVIFFSVTVHRIRNTPHAQKNQKQTVEVWVYVKLFALTGLTWILQIVDAFIALSVLSYIVAILNGLQGLFLFLSYVCNKRVLSLCCGKQSDKPNSSHNSSQFSSLPSSQKSTKF